MLKLKRKQKLFQRINCTWHATAYASWFNVCTWNQKNIFLSCSCAHLYFSVAISYQKYYFFFIIKLNFCTIYAPPRIWTIWDLIFARARKCFNNTNIHTHIPIDCKNVLSSAFYCAAAAAGRQRRCKWAHRKKTTRATYRHEMCVCGCADEKIYFVVLEKRTRGIYAPSAIDLIN